MEIYLIRHGTTLANEKRLYCGQTDIPLTENGVSSILELKSELKSKLKPELKPELKSDLKPELKSGLINQVKYPQNADMYFTTGLIRTEQTLDLIYGPVHREALPKLAEYNFGSFEMKSHEELNNSPEFREDYQNWITDESGHTPCPGGESKKQFLARILAGYDELLKKSRSQGAEVVVLICHGGVIAYLMDHMFPNERNFYEWQPKPGHGHMIHV